MQLFSEFQLLNGCLIAARPGITDMGISHDGGTVEKTVSDGSFVLTAPADSNVVDYTATLTLSDGAALTATNPTSGDLYVASVNGNTATLKFNVSEEGRNMSHFSEFDLNLTKVDENTWTGGFTNSTGLRLNTMAGYLVGRDVQLAAAALPSPAWPTAAAWWD